MLPFLLISSGVWAQPKPDEILTQLDQSYYYPQNHGLEKLTARIQWEQLDPTSGKYWRNPDFIFAWDREGGREIRDFKLAKDENLVTMSRDGELEKQIQIYGELIIPLTLKQKFAHYHGKLNKVGRSKTRLLYHSDSLKEQIESYSLLVSMKDMFIEEIRFEQNLDPRKVSGSFRYQKRGDKWVAVESWSSFAIGGLNYQETSNYHYKKFDGIWLVHRIDQTVKQDGQIIQSHRFKVLDVATDFSRN